MAFADGTHGNNADEAAPSTLVAQRAIPLMYFKTSVKLMFLKKSSIIPSSSSEKSSKKQKKYDIHRLYVASPKTKTKNPHQKKFSVAYNLSGGKTKEKEKMRLPLTIVDFTFI